MELINCAINNRKKWNRSLRNQTLARHDHEAETNCGAVAQAQT